MLCQRFAAYMLTVPHKLHRKKSSPRLTSPHIASPCPISPSTQRSVSFPNQHSIQNPTSESTLNTESHFTQPTQYGVTLANNTQYSVTFANNTSYGNPLRTTLNAVTHFTTNTHAFRSHSQPGRGKGTSPTSSSISVDHVVAQSTATHRSTDTNTKRQPPQR